MITDTSVHPRYRKEAVMGWLYMKSFKDHSGPRQYLDALFTWDRSDTTSKVLRSALVGMRVYYAAVSAFSLPPACGRSGPPFAWSDTIRAIGRATSSATRICRRQWGRTNAIAPSPSSIY